MWGDLWRCLYGITWAFINSISVEIFSIFFFSLKIKRWLNDLEVHLDFELVKERIFWMCTLAHIYLLGFFSIDK